MNADGSDPINLTNNSLLFDGDPAWSPDGKKIAYSRDNAAADLIQVAVMNADGSSQTGLTNTVWDAQPDWQRVYLAKPSLSHPPTRPQVQPRDTRTEPGARQWAHLGPATHSGSLAH